MGKDLKIQLFDLVREAYRLGLVAGSNGNISVRDKEKDVIIITPSNIPYSSMVLEDMVIITLEGRAVSGRHKPSSEWKMHREIYSNKSEVGCVIHSHSPYATGFAVCQEKIPVILLEMIPYIGGDVPVAEIAMPGSVEIGTGALKVLVDRKACLLSNHGTLAVGETIKAALSTAICLEETAKVYHIAKTAGDIKYVSHAFLEEMNRLMM